jgi:hypothetical protein
MAFLLEPSQVVKREELADYIALVDAKSTPFLSRAPKGKDLGNSLFSWTHDAYDATKGSAVSVPDGTDILLNAFTSHAANRVKLNNYGQTFRTDFRVGFLAQEVSNVAGVTDEVSTGKAHRMVEFKRAIEAAMCATDQYAVADNGTVGYLTKGLGDYISTDGGSSSGASGTVCPSGVRTPTASIDTTATASLADTNVHAVLTSIYGQTGQIKDLTLLCGTTLKRAFTLLTKASSTASASTNTITQSAVRTFTMPMDATTYRQNVGIFEGDFGTLELVPTNFIGTTLTNSGAFITVQPFKGYVLDWDKVELRYGMLPKWEEGSPNGGGPAHILTAFAGLVVKSPLALGKFNGSS